MNPFLFNWEVHLYLFFFFKDSVYKWYHIFVSVWLTADRVIIFSPSMLLQMTLLHSVLWLSNIPLYFCTTSSLSRFLFLLGSWWTHIWFISSHSFQFLLRFKLSCLWPMKASLHLVLNPLGWFQGSLVTCLCSIYSMNRWLRLLWYLHLLPQTWINHFSKEFWFLLVRK